MIRFKMEAAIGLVLVASALVTPEVDGQQRLSVQGHGGITIPTGRLADITDPGPTLGIQMSYPMTPRTAIKVTGDLDDLDGARLGSARAPDMKLWRYGIGVERQLVAQRATRPSTGRPVAGRSTVVRQRPARWSVVGDLGLGVTRFHSKEFAVPGSATATMDFSETYLATAAGLTLKYRAAERVQLFAGTRGSLSFGDKSDTAVLASLDPRAQARAFGSAVAIPVSAGFSIRM